MKRLLVVGASILQVPAIIKAKEMGLYVAVVDYDSNAIGIKYADDFYNVSTIDQAGVLKVAKKLKIDGIMTLATDMPMRTIAYVAKEMELPGISMETAIKATDKGEMIKSFKEHNVESPWFYIISNEKEYKNIIDKIKYPCVVKPVDSSGSRGVSFVDNSDDLSKAYIYSKKISKNGNIIIEEFLSGSEVSVEVMTIDGVPHILAITDKLTTGAPHFVEMGHSQPSQISSENINKIKNLAIKAVNAIELKNGPAHVEIMLTNNGPKMIEIGARMGGDNITTHLVPLSTGIDMVKATIDIALGNIPDIEPKFKKGSAIRYIKTNPGVIKEILGLNAARAIPGIKEIYLTKNTGEYVGEITNSIDRLGYVISQCEDVKRAIKACEDSIKKIKIKLY